MLILGINDTHDASAAIIKDGKLLIAIAEERVQRIKGMGGFPFSAIEECLRVTGLKKTDFDHIAVGNKGLVPNNMWNVSPSFTIQDYLKMQEEYYHPWLFQEKGPKLKDVFPNYKPKGKLAYPLDQIPFSTTNELNSSDVTEKINVVRKNFICQFLGVDAHKVNFYDHHHCHAYYAYFVNQHRKERTTVITADAGGDHAYSSIHVVEDGKFQLVHKARNNLIGKIYSSITLILGMKPNEHEYKVMGLAPYASEHQKKGPREIFMKSLWLDGLNFVKDEEMKDHFFYFRDKLKPFRFDGIAGGLQDFAEDRLTEWFINIHKETETHDFVFSGGVANNIKATKKISELDFVNSLFVPTGPGDENLSIGAAYCALYEMTGPKKTAQLHSGQKNGYWGNDVCNKSAQEFADHPLVKNNYQQIKNCDLKIVAEVLAKGEVVGLCHGRMEFGARALGHRSLVADPSNPNTLKKINDLIKKRDFWMPFTPSILDENYDDYVINEKKHDSTFMTMSFDTTELAQKHLKSAIHPYDFTVRPQRVTPDLCSVYYQLIKEFKAQTGIGALLNTSLNIHGKPIVMNPIDIVKEILENDIPLKYILINNDFYQMKP